MPSTACAYSSSHWSRTAQTMSQPTPVSSSAIASSARSVATSDGTPRRRIHPITGANAHARISAMTSGIVTRVSCWIANTMPATTTTTTMIWIARMPSLPKPSAHRLHGARVALGSTSCVSTTTRWGSLRNSPMRRGYAPGALLPCGLRASPDPG